jgi:hypothetical protein
VDEATGTLVVQSANNILFFASAPSGNVAPRSSIGSAITGIERPGGLAFDPVRAELLVANQGSIPAVTAYDDNAIGFDVRPLRSLNTPSSGNSLVPNGVAYAAARDEVAVATGLAQVPIYARGASGSAAPVRVISGPATRLRRVTAVAVDATSDTVVVNDNDNIIRRYALSFTDGNQAPLNSIGGASTGLSGATGVFVDGVNREIVVGDHSSVSVFRLSDDGDVAPIRRLSVQDGVLGVLVDPAANELFVIRNGGAEVDVFTRTATDSAAPARIIASLGQVKSVMTGLTFCN